MPPLRLILVVPLVLLAAAVAPYGRHLPLDPEEPAAADRSMTAGHARTIYDFEPVLGAFTEPKPSADPDDRRRLARMKHWTDRSRESIVHVFVNGDWPRCDEADRRQLIAAVRTYYDARGRQKAAFALRGPRARALIADEWSTPLDQRIDDFVRLQAAAGVLSLRDLPARSYPEFAKVTADTKVTKKACDPTKAL